MSDSNLMYLVLSMCAFGFVIPMVFPSLMGLDKTIDKELANKKPWRN